ncbi:hypothetical protein LV779_27540 [Streptomyces thinghirensis]|nr:hypothetical protein [Streptomyces thinghirensis]
MTEVLSSAIAEVEQYSRVRLVPPIDGTLRGHAVADVIHLLAELVENATLFSAPQTQVLMRANLVTSGLAVEVEDCRTRDAGRRAEPDERPARRPRSGQRRPPARGRPHPGCTSSPSSPRGTASPSACRPTSTAVSRPYWSCRRPCWVRSRERSPGAGPGRRRSAGPTRAAAAAPAAAADRRPRDAAGPRRTRSRARSRPSTPAPAPAAGRTQATCRCGARRPPDRPTPAAAVPGVRPEDRGVLAEHAAPPPVPRARWCAAPDKPQLPRRRARGAHRPPAARRPRTAPGTRAARRPRPRAHGGLPTRHRPRGGPAAQGADPHGTDPPRSATGLHGTCPRGAHPHGAHPHGTDPQDPAG